MLNRKGTLSLYLDSVVSATQAKNVISSCSFEECRLLQRTLGELQKAIKGKMRQILDISTEDEAEDDVAVRSSHDTDNADDDKDDDITSNSIAQNDRDTILSRKRNNKLVTSHINLADDSASYLEKNDSYHKRLRRSISNRTAATLSSTTEAAEIEANAKTTCHLSNANVNNPSSELSCRAVSAYTVENFESETRNTLCKTAIFYEPICDIFRDFGNALFKEVTDANNPTDDNDDNDDDDDDERNAATMMHYLCLFADSIARHSAKLDRLKDCVCSIEAKAAGLTLGQAKTCRNTQSAIKELKRLQAAGQLYREQGTSPENMHTESSAVPRLSDGAPKDGIRRFLKGLSDLVTVQPKEVVCQPRYTIESTLKKLYLSHPGEFRSCEEYLLVIAREFNTVVSQMPCYRDLLEQIYLKKSSRINV